MSNPETYIMRAGSASVEDLVDGFNRYPGRDYLGRTYYVNNITGSSSFNGLGWKSAMDEPSIAITASNAWRQRTLIDTGNEYVRNTIYMQGTSTPYAEITELPDYCDLVGIGASPFGNGSGIARIGLDTGSGGGLTGTSDVRGLRMWNLQFQAGVSNYPFQVADIFRSEIHDCVFTSNGSPGGPPAVGFEVERAGGLRMWNCLWLNQSSQDAMNDVGFDVTGTHFHGCEIRDCYIGGVTAAFRVASGTITAYNSILRDNFIGWGSETCAIGVDDNATVGHIIYARNTVFATDEYDLTHNASRIIGFPNSPS